MVCSLLRSSWLTVCGGMRAIFAMMSSISVLPMVFFCFDFGRMRCAAPASSMTSIALSGRWRSLMKRAASSAAVVSADAEYLTPWCSSKRDFRPRRICTVCSTVGSLTSIFWKRRDSAWSFSNTPRNSVIGGRADALELAVGQRRLQQIRRIQRAARRRTGADDGVDLVDEQDAVRACPSAASARPSGAARNRRDTWCRPAARPCRANTRRRSAGSRARLPA